MAESNIAKELNALSEKDIYSLTLFALYKLKDDPKYSTLSELVYVLDKQSLFNFLSVFEGLTIKVPKMSELQDIVHGLMLFALVNVQGMPFDKALLEILDQTMSKDELLASYETVCNVIDAGEFKREGDHE